MSTYVVLRFGGDPPRFQPHDRRRALGLAPAPVPPAPDRWWATVYQPATEHKWEAWIEQPFDTQYEAMGAAHRFPSRKQARLRAGYTKMGRRRVFMITGELGAILDFAEVV